MYKDKARQREAQRDWVRQKRANKQGSTRGSTKRGLDIKCFEDLPLDVQHTIDRISTSPEEKAKRTVAAIKYQHLYPERYHSTGVECVYMKEQRQRVGAGHVQVSKPGDEDYVPMCETTKALHSDGVVINWEGITPQPLVMINLDP